jgi:hypothetical protein
MASTLESSDSTTEAPEQTPQEPQKSQPPGWLKVGAIAAASALAGGLAAAWFYRKTLTKLQEGENGVRTGQVRTSEADLEVDE